MHKQARRSFFWFFSLLQNPFKTLHILKGQGNTNE
jgi:hypothetical protein